MKQKKISNKVVNADDTVTREDIYTNYARDESEEYVSIPIVNINFPSLFQNKASSVKDSYNKKIAGRRWCC